MGFLGWPPRDFWDTRVSDIMDAVDGAMMREGVFPEDIEAELVASEDARRQRELDRLMEQYPDG
jgi:hypothetical protein